MPSASAPIQFDCTNCGARLSVDGRARMVGCTYCRTEMMLPEAIWLQFHPAPKYAPPPAVSIAIPRVPRGLVLGIVGGVVLLVVGSVVAVGVLVGGVRDVATSALVPSGVGSPLNPIAAVGEACSGRRAACSTDGKAELSCGADGKMAVAGTCRGPNACRATGGGKSISCDVTLADRNDPCDVTDDACSTDHKAELQCRAGKFAVLATCKGPDGCTLTPSRKGSGYTLSCDDHIADVGDACFDAKRTACSSDKKAFLACTAQKYAVDHACKGGCTVKKLAGTDNVEMSCR